MKKHIFLPVLAAIGGVLGGSLRFWQRAYLNQETQLFRPGAPATTALAVFLCALAAAFLLLIRKSRAPGDYRAAFGRTESVIPMVGGALLMLAAGALHLLECAQRFPLYRSGADRLPLMELLAGVLAIAGGGALLPLARGFRRGELPRGWQVMTTLPAYAVLPWLVGLYQEHSRQPEIWLFGITVLGGVCTALGLYCAAAFAFERPWRKRCLFFSLMGEVLLLTSLADASGWADGVMAIACLSLLLGQSCALLWDGPAKEEARPEEVSGQAN